MSNYYTPYSPTDINERIQNIERVIRQLDLDLHTADSQIHNLHVQVNDLESISNLQSSRYALNQSITSMTDFLMDQDLFVDPVVEQLEEEVTLLEKASEHLKNLVFEAQQRDKKLDQSISQMSNEKDDIERKSMDLELKKSMMVDLQESVRSIDNIDNDIHHLNNAIGSLTREVGSIDEEIQKFNSTLNNTIVRNRHIQQTIIEKESLLKKTSSVDINELERQRIEKENSYRAMIEESEKLAAMNKEYKENHTRIIERLETKKKELESYFDRLDEHMMALKESKSLNDDLSAEITERRNQMNQEAINRLSESKSVASQVEELKNQMESIQRNMLNEKKTFTTRKESLATEIYNLEALRMETLSQLLDLNNKNNLETFQVNGRDNRRTDPPSDPEEVTILESQIEAVDKDLVEATKVLDSYILKERRSNLFQQSEELNQKIQDYNRAIDNIQLENDELTKSINSTGDSHSNILSELSDQISRFEEDYNLNKDDNQSVMERLLLVYKYLLEKDYSKEIYLDFTAGDRVIFKKSAIFGGRFQIIGDHKFYFLSEDSDIESVKGKSYFPATIIFLEPNEATVDNNPMNLVLGTQYFNVIAQPLNPNDF